MWRWGDAAATIPVVAALEKQVGRRIRQFRQAAGLTLEELAGATGLHANTLGLIERGEQSATVSALGGIAKGLRTDVSTLVDVASNRGVRGLRTDLSQRIGSMNATQLRAVKRMLDAARDL